jgi:hypothetical protein
MDNKQLLIIAAGIVVLAIVVIGAAFVVLNDNGGSSATPTPAATATPGPTATGPTANPGTGVTPTPMPGGPLVISAQVDKTGTMGFVSIALNAGTAPIDSTHMNIRLVCDGQTYSNFWTLKPGDWDRANGDAKLDPGEIITTQLDLKTLGVPKGRPFTIQILQDSTVLQEKSVTPT